jgi:hypothetical protein
MADNLAITSLIGTLKHLNLKRPSGIKFARNQHETPTHKRLKQAVVKELLALGYSRSQIKLEQYIRLPQGQTAYGFHPDVSLIDNGNYTFFECQLRSKVASDKPNHTFKFKGLVGAKLILVKGIRKIIRVPQKFVTRTKPDAIWFVDLATGQVVEKLEHEDGQPYNIHSYRRSS